VFEFSPMTTQIQESVVAVEHRASLAHRASEGPIEPRRIWIDLENSPHVPFFKPVITELEKRGHTVILTARDCFQVCDLLELFGMKYVRIGRHYGKYKLAKAAGLGFRILQLAPRAAFYRPDLCLSHGSRAQFVLASLLRIPNLIIFDYEFSSWAGPFRPKWIMGPEVIPTAAVCGDGIPEDRLLRYPGIKEDIYAPSFRPEPGFRQRLGVQEHEILVTLRPPASEAHYHNPEAESLLSAVFQLFAPLPDIKIVVVPRTPKQGAEIRQRWPELFQRGVGFIPDRAVNGLDLIWNSDLVISGGGTMNREAAALGVPVYSIFRGPIGAVDRYLADHGRLVLLETPDDVRSKIKIVRRRISGERADSSPSAALQAVVQNIQRVLSAEGSNT
jgi:predicted glycosyltransferase